MLFVPLCIALLIMAGHKIPRVKKLHIFYYIKETSNTRRREIIKYSSTYYNSTEVLITITLFETSFVSPFDASVIRHTSRAS